MNELIEAPIDNWIASFDGRVLEILTPHMRGSLRYHVKLISQCSLDGNVLKVVFPDRDNGLWPFRDFQRQQVEALVWAVELARTS